jgi:hypothetical protein
MGIPDQAAEPFPHVVAKHAGECGYQGPSLTLLTCLSRESCGEVHVWISDGPV